MQNTKEEFPGNGVVLVAPLPFCFNGTTVMLDMYVLSALVIVLSIKKAIRAVFFRAKTSIGFSKLYL